MKQYRRLPDGYLTRNEREYVRAWRKLAKPIEKATNSKLFGFNPGLIFTTKTLTGEYNWTLGIYEAKMLVAAIEKKAMPSK